MRMSVKIVALMLLASGVGVAQAGVIIQQQDANHVGTPVGKGVRTMMIEGHKEKLSNGDSVVILDVDGGKTLMIRTKTKSYFELSFPPQGIIGKLIRRQLEPFVGVLTKTGKQKTLLGHHCDEYTGSTAGPKGAVSTAFGCYSTDAPGAADYAAFAKASLAKFEADNPDALKDHSQPDGVPLEMRTVVGPGPDAKGVNRGRQLISERNVTSITAQAIAPTEFAVPAGYTKKPPPAFGLGLKKPHHPK
jgi:hypothetical protein